MMVELSARAAGINTATIAFHSLHRNIPDMQVLKKGTSGTWILNPERMDAVKKRVEFYLANLQAKVIVINDEATLEFFTGYRSLDLCRGSVYMYGEIPCIVVDNILKLNTVNHFNWVMHEDCKKINRWVEDKRRKEPKFSYQVVANQSDIDRCVSDCANAHLIAVDSETALGMLSSIQYSALMPDGKVVTYVFPFIDPTKAGGIYWDTPDLEVAAWNACKSINGNAVIKTLQNGAYDCAYFIKYRIPLNNYLLDSLHLFHSIWTEAPKKLNFISSMLLDHCQYWKDESKGDKDETVPKDPERLWRYWRYGALDTWHTLLDTIWLVRIIAKLDWARSNYNVEFSLQVGPALAGSMRGFRVDRKRQWQKKEAWQEESEAALKKLRIMVDNEEFNPNSPYQVASLIYDVLGAKPIPQRGKNKKSSRSVDEKVLENIRIKHQLFAVYIDEIWEAKKPANNISKYGPLHTIEDANGKEKWIGMRLENGRWLYALGAAGTETGRFNSKGHQFWVGQAAQNVPDRIKDMVVADEGYFFLEIDYSQSDAYYVAHEAEDEKYIATMLGDRDTHCVHAEHFFKVPYDKIYEAYKRKEDWVVHPLKGVRQNTKRIVHGSNFQMSGFTLYITMKHDAAIAAAIQLGYVDAGTWGLDKLVTFCQKLLDSYHVLYPRLRPWFRKSLDDAIANGNKATCAFGRTRLFFGNMAKSPDIQRELSAYYGQGGTSGAINKTLLDYYYRSDLEEHGTMFLTQTHDSILWQIPIDRIDLARKCLTLMEQPCMIKGREFTVPAEGKCGFSWGDKWMVGFNPDLADSELLHKMRQHEMEMQTRNYG